MMQPQMLTSSSANGSRECAPDDRLRRMIQYSATPMNFCDGGDYWIPAFRGYDGRV
jgi:hypothetical protein